MKRRDFLKHTTAVTGSVSLAMLTDACSVESTEEPLFRISLAEWSLHHSIWNGSLDHLDFAVVARRDYGLEAVEYVNTLFVSGTETAYLREMKTRADGEGVSSLLIMCDGIDPLASSDETARMQAVEGHYPWIEAAQYLGCRAIRVNARLGPDTTEEPAHYFAEAMRLLGEFGAEHNIHILLENHGGISSNAAWVADAMEAADHPFCGTLPDFGNSELSADEVADPYDLVATLMPYARGHVSAKAETFSENSYLVGVDAFYADGNRVMVDYERMLKIVLDAGFRGYVGVEFQGLASEDEPEGIRKTKALLERAREELAPAY